MKKTFALIAAGLCLTSAPALAQTVAPAAPAVPAVHPTYAARVITLAEAKSVVAAAEAEARKNGWSMVITVVESNGAVVLSEKMDGAQYGSIDGALKKAQTATNFRRPTSYFQDAVKAGTLNAIFTGALAIEGAGAWLPGG